MICKKCNKHINEVKPLHFSNQIARKLGYCAFICMAGDVGKEKAFENLKINRPQT